MVVEWMQTNPKVSIILFSALVTFCMTLITKFTTDQKRMKELRAHSKEAQKKLKEHRHDPKKVQELNEEMVKHSLELMKHSFRPLLITFIPLILFFMWIRGVYAEVLSSWLWWYIGSGIIAGLIFRKVLRVA